MHLVSPWTATVQDDIEKSTVIWEKKFRDYIFKAYNTSNSLLIVVSWPNNARVAFRAAFGMNSFFEITNLFDDGRSLLINLENRIGQYEVRIDFPNPDLPMLHYKTVFKGNFSMMIPFWPRDIMPLTKSGNIWNTSGEIHMHQMGSRTGILYASMTKPKTGSFFYFQDLGSMSAYCEATETSLTETVGGSWPEIGFQLPLSKEKALPADTEFVLSDAYVLFSEEIIKNEAEKTQQFLNNLAAVYQCLPHPETVYHNWPEIAENCLNDLSNNKGCWTQTKGVPYLNAYLCDYTTPAEVMVQLAILMPLKEYSKWKGEDFSIYKDLISGIDAFYEPKISTISRYLPQLSGELDHSEEQKKDMVMDSWYLHHPLMNLARLALNGEKKAEELLLKSCDFAIKVAHHFDYQWPVFYKMDTLEVIKEETEPGEGGEKDVAGSYAHLMLLLLKLTDDKRYLREAEKAVLKLQDKGFDIFYQANNTAFSASALLELYKITKKQLYLDLSYACLAGLFKNMQIWDCLYGNGKNISNYFAIYPLNNAPYIAAYEELEVYAALTNYLMLSKDVEILPSLKILIPEFIKYALSRISYYFPRKLPLDMLSKEVKTGEIQPELWIPLEDVYIGWEKSGQVGQEVYGTGMAFGIVSRQYFKVDSEGFLLFTDYPIGNYKKSKNTVTMKILGTPEFQCSFKIFFTKQVRKSIEVSHKKNIIPPVCKDQNVFHYEIPGGSTIKISW
ncbi:hypothetical protein [Flavobacterium sp.]|uniref:hypothetical protein n=1 Tax=Flavobacterium sp. TaxID=239 RepID=UPI002D0F87BB|nr:hypothetical protein [Flavobacterium sp.]HSD06663.1 hypothetical protein [Flavobacterium sp.]